MRPVLPLLLALMVAACARTPVADVTRFHLNQPIPFDTVSVVAPPGVTSTLEEQSKLAAVAAELGRLGFRPVPENGSSAYVATLRSEQASREGMAQGSPVSIGIGGGSFGRGGGMGGGLSFPIGKSRAGPRIMNNMMMLEIKRRSDNQVIWEGRAMQEVTAKAETASLAAAVPALARALLADFPGPSGQQVQVPTP